MVKLFHVPFIYIYIYCRSVYQEEDEERYKGLKISKDLVAIGGDALKANITTLGPLVLPFSEQLYFFANLVLSHFRRRSNSNNHRHQQQTTTTTNNRPYIPDYRLAFEHFCVHAASKTVLDELQRNLGLTEKNMEASRATLQRFGNTSSSSIWYELAYLEAKEEIKSGDRIWQISFGSGFKCNSAVWRSVRRLKKPSTNPWIN